MTIKNKLLRSRLFLTSIQDTDNYSDAVTTVCIRNNFLRCSQIPVLKYQAIGTPQDAELPRERNIHIRKGANYKI